MSSNKCKDYYNFIKSNYENKKVLIYTANTGDKDKKDLLIPHIDNLLNTCALKLNVAHNVYLISRDCPVDEVFKLFKGLFTVIIDVSSFLEILLNSG